MKNLSDYMQSEQTELFKETGSFFAISDSQFDEKKKEGVVYVSLGYGLICPKENAQKLKTGLDDIFEKSIQMDIAENGAEAIIKRAMWDHESFYDGDFSRAKEALEIYNFPDELFEKVRRQEWKNYAESDYCSY